MSHEPIDPDTDEQRLLRYKATQTALLDALPAHVALLDEHGVIVAVNESWKRFACANQLGSPGFGIGLNYTTLCDDAVGDHADDARRAVLGIRSVLSGQEPTFAFEYACHAPLLQQWFQMTVTRLHGRAVRGAVVMHVDISERKRAEQEAGRLALRLTNTLESITDGFFMVDREWRFTYVNREAERMFGRRRAELIGRVCWDEFPHTLGTAFEHAYRRAIGDNVTVSFEAFYAPLDAWFRVNGYPSDEGLAVSFKDVGNERAARLQLELLESSVSQLNDIVMITEGAPLDSPGPRIVFVNDAFVRATGYTLEDVIGKSPRLLHGPLTDPAELDRVSVALARFQPVHAELLNYRKNGEPFWVEIDIAPVGVEGAGYSHFVTIERDIGERKRGQEALRQLNAELEGRVRERTAEFLAARDEADQASRAKSAFLATMSHEIRTPMNGVLGMIEVLHQTSLKAHQVEMVDLIRESAFSLLKIIEDILDFSKIEAGKLAIENEPMRLADVVEKVCGLLDPMAGNRDSRLSVFVDPLIPPMVLGDETRLRQVLVNLVGNAIKFSAGRDQPGRVSVRALLAGRQARTVTVDLVVADNGIGMDESTLAWLFTPFSQADASTTRRFGGTGLGLAISAMLVRLMGGDILVRSELDHGSTFTVQLAFDAADAINADQGAGAGAGAASAGPADELPSVAGLQCRIVGGEASLADDLGAYLTHAGATVERSPDLAAAAAAGRPPGLGLWLVLPGQTPPPALAVLRQLAPADGVATTRFVVFGHGSRRRPRVEAVDLVTIDADSLFRRTLFRALALASGRLEDEALNEPGGAVAAGQTAALQPEQAMTLRHDRLILVAEDNETNRKVILRQLQLIGFAAEVVVNGEEALERWRSGDFALLLTDLHMPRMDGYALAAAIRAEERAGCRLPIIALTANALRDEERRCREAGMDAYLTKPIRLPQLTAAIEAWLGPAVPAQAAWDSRRAAAAAAPAADLAVLVALVGDDPLVIGELLQAFGRTAAQSSQELKHGIDAGSVQAVANAAHKLKSGARSIGAQRLGGVCDEIQRAAETGRYDMLGMLLPRFDTELNAVRAFLGSR